jgi:hypothetical protein
MRIAYKLWIVDGGWKVRKIGMLGDELIENKILDV